MHACRHGHFEIFSAILDSCADAARRRAMLQHRDKVCANEHALHSLRLDSASPSRAPAVA